MAQENKEMNILYTRLPAKFLPDSDLRAPPPSFVQDLLKKEMRPGDHKEILNQLEWNFVLDKFASKAKTLKRIRRKKTFLTRKQRVELQILKLGKTGWNYASLEPIRVMWKEYMRENLDLANKVPTPEDPEWASFSLIVAKSELIGGEIKVIRSLTPSQVGISGTIVLETKMTFQIVTRDNKLKTLPKATSVFELLVDNLKFTVFGKHLTTKPSERSVKKIKGQMLPDL